MLMQVSTTAGIKNIGVNRVVVNNRYRETNLSMEQQSCYRKLARKYNNLAYASSYWAGYFSLTSLRCSAYSDLKDQHELLGGI